MKVFLDRMNPLYDKMKDKDFYYMVTAQDDNRVQLDRAFDVFDGFADCFDDIRRRRWLTPEGKSFTAGTRPSNRCTIREVKSARDAIRSREDNANASAESLNSKMKAFRAQLRGVSNLPFFMYRLSTIFG